MENEKPNVCPFCQSALKHIPAGISKKTGKPYSEFWSCINKDCKFTWSAKKKVPYTPAPKVTQSDNKEVVEQLKEVNKTLAEILEMVASIVKETTEI